MLLLLRTAPTPAWTASTVWTPSAAWGTADPAAPTLPYTETFTGSNGAAWPGGWTARTATGGTVDIQGNTGRIQGPATGSYLGTRADYTAAGNLGDSEIVGTVVGTGTVEQYVAVSLNSDGGLSQGTYGQTGANSYSLVITYGAGRTIQLYQDTGTTETLLASGPTRTLTGSTLYGFRFRRQGQLLSARVWDAATTEPTSWEVTYTLTGTPLTGWPALGVENGDTTTSRQFQFDDVTISVPSTSTDYPTVGTAAGSGTATGTDRAAYTVTGTAAGSGTTTGVDVAADFSTGTAAGTGTTTGSTSAAYAVTGTATGSGTATGTDTAADNAVGTAAGTGTATGSTTVAVTVTGTSTGTGVATGSDQLAASTAGTATGAGTTSATVTAGYRTAGAATGAGTATGDTGGSASVTGTTAGTGTATGTAVARYVTAGTAGGSGTSSGTASAAVSSSGTSGGTGGTTGTSRAGYLTTGTATGYGTATGTSTGGSYTTVTAVALHAGRKTGTPGFTAGGEPGKPGLHAAAGKRPLLTVGRS